MSKRNSYHSTIKLAYAFDIQNQWLPKDFLQSIPRSTSHAWKAEVKDKFVGYQYASQINDNVDELKLLFHRQASRERRIFISLIKLKITLVNVLGKDTLKAAIKDNFRAFVKLIGTSKNSFNHGIKSFCAILDINPKTYTYWKRISQFNCSASAVGLCLKRASNQATPHEIKVMKSLLRRKRFIHWPIRSVWAYAFRNEHISLSLSSWYRYNKKFEFRHIHKKGHFKKAYEPIVAPVPNHTWHADITIFKTTNNVKHYIYLIVDNYSKFIINWKVSLVCNGKLRTQTIREAVLQEFGEDITQTKSIDLIVDGGTENNNRTVEQFIKDSQVTISKKIALKDIKQSNSMVEASNKILKYQYLFRKPIHNTDELIKHMEDAIHDFCYIRPHGSLGILTPFEAHKNKIPKLNPVFKKNAVKERIKSNKLSSCSEKCD